MFYNVGPDFFPKIFQNITDSDEFFVWPKQILLPKQFGKWTKLSLQFNTYLWTHSRFPWNQQTAIGYACEIVFSFISGDAYFITNGALLLLFISMCWTHEAFYKMFVHLTRELDHFDNNRNDAEHLAKLIRFHVETKGWFSDTAKVYSLFILVQLICSMIFLASAIFQLDLVILTTFSAFLCFLFFYLSFAYPYLSLFISSFLLFPCFYLSFLFPFSLWYVCLFLGILPELRRNRLQNECAADVCDGKRFESLLLLFFREDGDG